MLNLYIIRARHFRIRVANLTGFIYIRPFLYISDEGKILPTGDDHPSICIYLFGVFLIVLSRQKFSLRNGKVRR
jgi:hypothetical protein